MIQTKELYQLFLESKGVCTDTRSIDKGCIFFALKGGNFNGNEFALNAIENGATYAVIDEEKYAQNDKCILVANVLESLQDMATFHRKQLGIPIIGITGTNGKTTTKELVYEVLKRKFKTYATKGNFNNHIGVPLTLLSMDSYIEIGIVEMGANHVGEIEELCNICDPDYGIITNVGKAHLEGFGSFEGIKVTKSALYRHVEKKGGVLFVNDDNDHLMGLLGEGAHLIKYGKNQDCYVRHDSLYPNPFLQFSCFIKDVKVEVKSKLVGAYNLENALASICAGAYFGVGNREITTALESYSPTNNRSQYVETEKNKILFDAYNANPTSMMKALSNFVEINGENKFAILGEMKELGKDSDKEHKAVLDYLQKNFVGGVYLVGKGYLPVLNSDYDFMHFEDVENLIAFIKQNDLKGKMLLVKGSRSNKLEKLKDVL